jgi:hypothetical protein
MLQIGFDGSPGNAHLEGDLVVLAPLARQIRHLALTGRKREPAVVEIKAVPICGSAASSAVLLVGWVCSVDKV